MSKGKVLLEHIINLKNSSNKRDKTDISRTRAEIHCGKSLQPYSQEFMISF